MGTWQAIVFDLDDTLFPERDFVLGGFRAVARLVAEHRGIPADRGYAELAALYATGARGDTFDRWLGLHGLPTTLVPALIAAYRAHTPAVRPFAGVPTLLGALHARAALGLLSDGYLEVQRRKLAALRIGHHFDAVVFSDQLGREHWKPSAYPFEVVTSLLGVGGPAAVYVADNPAKDFIGARAAGLATVWSRHSGGDYARRVPPSPAHAADFVVNSLPRLAALLFAHLPLPARVADPGESAGAALARVEGAAS